MKYFIIKKEKNIEKVNNKFTSMYDNVLKVLATLGTFSTLDKIV